VNTEHFKAQLAGTVAAKAGISSKQAKQIVHCIIGLPGRTTKKRLNLFGLGEVIVIKQQAPAKFDPTFTCAVKIPYKGGAKFDVAKKFKTLVFRDLERAKRKPSKYYEETGFEKIVTFGGLEGDPDVPVRRPKKGWEPIKAEPEGDPDTNVRRPGPKPSRTS
jgi:nucleoid DNA-binding protein